MGRDTTIIVDFAEARLSELSPVQEAIAAHLRSLKPETIRRSAGRFRNHVERKTIRIPSTRPALNTLKFALAIGVELNCLNPDPVVAARWLAVREAGGLEVRGAWSVSDDGMSDFTECLDQKTEKRRNALKKHPKGWFGDTLELARRSNDSLHAAILVIALSGCRSIEVAGMRVVVAGAHLDLTIECAKDHNAKEAQKEKKAPQPRFREMRFSSGCALSEWVEELQRLLRQLPFPYPFSGLSAKSIENAFKRISMRLVDRDAKAITASCFRNQFSADLKRGGFPEELISFFMGHVSLKTKSAYGTYHQGRPGRRGYLSLTDTSRDGSRPHQPLTNAHVEAAENIGPDEVDYSEAEADDFQPQYERMR